MEKYGIVIRSHVPFKLPQNALGWQSCRLHRLTRRYLSGHDVRLDSVGRGSHGIKVEKFTSPMERYLQEVRCGQSQPSPCDGRTDCPSLRVERKPSVQLEEVQHHVAMPEPHGQPYACEYLRLSHRTGDNAPQAIKTTPVARPNQCPFGSVFSSKTNAARPTIQYRFITPPKNKSVIRNQQQPKQ